MSDPTPQGPRALAKASAWWSKENLIVVAAAAGTALVAVSVISTPSHGATRSSRLQWEKQQEEVRQAVQQLEAQPADDTRES